MMPFSVINCGREYPPHCIDLRFDRQAMSLGKSEKERQLSRSHLVLVAWSHFLILKRVLLQNRLFA